MFGVVQALAASGQLGAFAHLQPPLLIMATVSVVGAALAASVLFGLYHFARDIG